MARARKDADGAERNAAAAGRHPGGINTFANANLVDKAACMKDVDYRGSGEGAYDQPRPVGGAIFTRPITRTSRRRAWVVAICSALIGCIVSIARLWKYQLVITSARARSSGCLRSISSERHPVYDRLGGVAFRAANPPGGSMRAYPTRPSSLAPSASVSCARPRVRSGLRGSGQRGISRFRRREGALAGYAFVTSN